MPRKLSTGVSVCVKGCVCLCQPSDRLAHPGWTCLSPPDDLDQLQQSPETPAWIQQVQKMDGCVRTHSMCGGVCVEGVCVLEEYLMVTRGFQVKVRVDTAEYLASNLRHANKYDEN